ncbi:AAA family ATPase [Sulfitobacter sp. R18_1]|uniref:AAA family ATPase n=1 Tax=Sulfitobacter sp. R18_1 TaxID=2821104 RepID=UPI001AD9529D|nr:AAA family ATPase [Sulfitobacter sp. R18_1]MBO9432537.1 AAA family ATPase [Sulfitobacter sp. R18_1]
MNRQQMNAPLFPTSFSQCLARRAVAALCESTLMEWRSNLEQCYDYDDAEMDGEGNIDLLRPRVKSAPELRDLRQSGSVGAPPAAENMTSAEIEQLYATGEDPWACSELDVSPLWDIKPKPAAILAVLLLCAALKDEHMVDKMAHPGGITLLVCPPDGMRSVLPGVLPDLVKHWKADQLTLAGTQIATLHEETSASPSEKNRSIDKFRRLIDKRLRQHEAVLAVSSSKHSLSGEQLSLVRQVLNWPSVSPTAIIETLRYTHSNTQQLAENELLKRLPDATALRRLAPVQIDAAFEEATTLRVADRLTEIMHAHGGTLQVTLHSVKGLGTTVAALQRMVDDLALWQEGRVAWSDLTHSALFFGPPGTGKTLLATALAGSAGVPLVATSYADCQKAGHQGDMLAALSGAFERAAQAVPAVLFIDELDSFSTRTSGGHNDNYSRGVVNGLLEQINRANEVEGLIILAATNHLDDVDPAVTRSGRFDLKLQIPMPDLSGIEAILATKIGDRATSKLNLRAVAERLLGEPGATAEALIRDALGRARAERQDLRQEHLEAAADALVFPSDETLLHRIAIHEAGHVLVALHGPLPLPKRVWVTPQGGGVESAHLSTVTPKLAEAQLQMLLAGRAAEALLLEQPSNGAGLGTASDLAQATRLAAAIELQWAFGQSGLIWHDIGGVDLQALPSKVQQQIHSHIERASKAAHGMLAQNLDHLKHIASELVQSRELHQDDLERLAKRISGNIHGDAACPCLPPISTA